MLKSMTGFGKSVCELPGKIINIQIRSLNCKQLDINTKIPGLYKEKDLEIRNLIGQQLVRGKIELSFFIENTGDESLYHLNKDLAKRYYEELKSLEEAIDFKETTDYLQVLVRMPDVLKTELQELNDDEWKTIRKHISEAISFVDEFRVSEGAALEKDVVARTKSILNLLESVEEFEGTRIELVRQRIKTELQKVAREEDLDSNRFEQELVFYLEKLDITEEKVRLKKHCDYLLETINLNEPSGKKLGFIAQEMGREINTLGSKANDANIQKIVVNMKDELEKIKEQVLNIL